MKVMKNNNWPLAKTATIAILTALAFLGTLLIRIPIPVSTGYFNIGDIFVMVAGLWLGSRAGLIVGFLGPALADFIGFPQFILATAITKGFEGFIVGFIGGGTNEKSITKKVVAVTVGAITIVIGYFIFEVYIYPWLGTFVPFFAVTDLSAAIAELTPNAMQGLISAVVAISIWKAISGFNLEKNTNTENQLEN